MRARENKRRNGCRVWGQNQGMACADSQGMFFSVGVEAMGTKPGVAFCGKSGKALLDSSSCCAGRSCAAELCCGSSSVALGCSSGHVSGDGKRAWGGLCWCRRCSGAQPSVNAETKPHLRPSVPRGEGTELGSAAGVSFQPAGLGRQAGAQPGAWPCCSGSSSAELPGEQV